MRYHARARKDAPLRDTSRNAAKPMNHATPGPRRLEVVVSDGRRTGVGSPTRMLALNGGAPPPELVRAAAHAASANVTLVADSLRSAVVALRRGDWRNGRCLLTQGTTTVRTLVLVTDMLASTPGVRGSTQTSIDVIVTCLRGTLTALESRRSRGDWEGVMEILDDGLAELLREWSNELRAVGETTSGRLVPMPRRAASDRVSLDLPEAG